MKIVDVFVFCFSFIGSFLLKPYKVKGRSWYCECIFRSIKITILRSQNKPIKWLRIQQQTLSKLLPVSDKVAAQSINLAGLSCQYYSTEAIPDWQQLIVYFHGGGFVMNGGNAYYHYCQMLAKATGATVVLLDYRLAPEYRYPIAHNDCFDMTQALIERYPNAQFQFIGDSAGGALLLATYQRLLAEHRLPSIKNIALISPWVAPNRMDDSMLNNEAFDYLNHKVLNKWFEAYGEKEQQPLLEQASMNFSFKDTPPIFIQYSSHEVMVQQINEFAALGIKKGAEVISDPVDNLFHNFQIMALPTREAKQANQRLVSFLNANNAL